MKSFDREDLSDPRNDPAFPLLLDAVPHELGADVSYHEGLTKREYIASRAMQGLLAQTGCDISFTRAAREAVKYADALIEELAK